MAYEHTNTTKHTSSKDTSSKDTSSKDTSKTWHMSTQTQQNILVVKTLVKHDI